MEECALTASLSRPTEQRECALIKTPKQTVECGNSYPILITDHFSCSATATIHLGGLAHAGSEVRGATPLQCSLQSGLTGLTNRGGRGATGSLTTFTRETCSCSHFILAEILVLIAGAIPPAPAVPASTRISARLKHVQEHSSAVNMCSATEPALILA